MKKSLIHVIICTLFLCSCRSTKEAKTVYSDYKIEIYDSILIKKSESLDFLEYNRNNGHILFTNKNNQIIEVDNKGKVLHELNVLGDGDKEIGKFLQNAGYYDDKTIAVASEKGYYFFDLEGTLLRHKKDPNFPQSGIWKSLIHVKNGSTDCLIGSRKPPYDLKEFDFMSAEAPQNTLQLTCYAINQDTVFRAVRLRDGILKKYYYSIIPRIDALGDQLYIINSPETKIHVYKVGDKITHHKTIDFALSHYPLEQKAFGTQMKDIRKFLSMNSKIWGLSVQKNEMMIQYSPGMSDEEYLEFSSGKIPQEKLYKFMKHHLVWLKGNKKVCEILMPETVLMLLYFKNKDYILFKPNRSLVEHEDAEIFYIGKIVKEKNS